MKKIISVFCLCVAVTLMSSAQNPFWITADDPSGDETNTWIEFRKEFNLKKIPKKAEAHIAADTKYWLWVNDSLAVFEGGLFCGISAGRVSLIQTADGYTSSQGRTLTLKAGIHHLEFIDTNE